MPPSPYKVGQHIVLKKSTSDNYFGINCTGKTDLRIPASNLPELIERTGIRIGMCPNQFVLMHGGKRLGADENFNLTESGTYPCVILKPDAKTIATLSSFSPKNDSIEEIDTILTQEYHRCVQGEYVRVNPELGNYQFAIQTIRTNFLKAPNNANHSSKIVSYLDGLIETIEAIRVLKWENEKQKQEEVD